ncbi:SRPBCC family protein [Pseudomonas sp. N40(2020)]|uniref:SRPBCC family protein n=1 Tax=Pseudomonas sp. N40(2020) TaxID=2767798 RepID=UPI0016572796|nr:SRPBCC family protein [Pseudomonas sp. N40(2020)]MBC8999241.1 SRPBCC family protein [Pseudomonas sp. N40(2020)]
MPMVDFSAVLNSDAQRVWSVVKQFGEIHKWHPSIAESSIEGGGPDGSVACVRKLTLTDGAVVRERLLSVDDRALTLSYCIEEAPLPLDNYVATVRLVAITGQEQTLVTWSACFDLQEPNTAEHYQALIRSLIVDGHKGLQSLLTQ